MWWILATLLGGCDDTTFPAEVPDTPEGDGYEGVVEVFDSSCTGCHGPSGSFPDLQTDPCAAIVDQASQAYTGTLVVPGDAEASVLWHKMSNSETYGGIMPQGADDPIDEAGIIEAWIDSGAACD